MKAQSSTRNRALFLACVISGALFLMTGCVTDILNLGRLIFYTFAGALVMSPLQAIVKLLSESQQNQSDSFFVKMSYLFRL